MQKFCKIQQQFLSTRDNSGEGKEVENYNFVYKKMENMKSPTHIARNYLNWKMQKPWSYLMHIKNRKRRQNTFWNSYTYLWLYICALVHRSKRHKIRNETLNTTCRLIIRARVLPVKFDRMKIVHWARLVKKWRNIKSATRFLSHREGCMNGYWTDIWRRFSTKTWLWILYSDSATNINYEVCQDQSSVEGLRILHVNYTTC